MTEPDNEGRPRRGLAIAAIAIAAVSFVLVVSTWIAWLVVRPRVPAVPGYSIVAQVFVLALGALFFIALLAGVLAIVLGLAGGARERTGGLARGGTLHGALTCLIALVGAVAFAISPAWTPLRVSTSPIGYSDLGTGS
ncbi:hypothetical protein [Amycolatopsis sp. FDAARGOS 1241]|uniref:hypothetical protein n=1 Tax=Amycolatopsis sp. FDAARGOS 1241 TaxID=2778070 RepID=UPI00195167AE|nr:hypothetical protein [Amycolatopsis sp. FDAARGOS 1241]QRP43749.1 hypothetical protein I6J71_30925 [Amycolatopsis sp. FDAARGOS 1241]